jgi:hypothetical protein
LFVNDEKASRRLDSSCICSSRMFNLSLPDVLTKKLYYGLLTAIYEDELIEEPQRRENIIENIERQKEQLLVNILGPR